MGSDSRNEPRNEDITRATSFYQIDSFSLDKPENGVSVTEDDLFKHLVEMETTEFTVFCNENVSKISDSVHNGNDFYQMASDTRERCPNGSFVHSLESSFSRKRRKTVANGGSELSDFKDAGNFRNSNEKQNMEKLEEQLDHKPAAPNGPISPKANTETPEENRIENRLTRDQSTNRHNLAERIRRERINERMKFLQGLVPGCDKITGKAVMLDEIINYILSMQHQVEFLYRKLAAVNLTEKSQPDQLPSQDICPTQGVVITATEGDQEVNSFPLPVPELCHQLLLK